MQLSDPAIATLKTLAHAPDESGRQVSFDDLAAALPEHRPEELEAALEELRKHHLVESEDQGGVAITEAGVAALVSF